MVADALGDRWGTVFGAASLACICLSLGCAVAARASPFAITGFSVQTTHAREVAHGAGVPGYGFVNEAYAFTQAGGHPDALTSTLEFAGEAPATGQSPAADGPKDMLVELPPGLLADPRAPPRCPPVYVLSSRACPAATQVGVFTIHLDGGEAELGPIVDLQPNPGQAAALGLEIPTASAEKIIVPASGRLVRGLGGYALAIAIVGLPLTDVHSVETTLWGVPAEADHDALRGLFCNAADAGQPWSCEGGGESADVAPTPFLTLPTNCAAGPQQASAWADSWEAAGRFVQAQATLPAVTGCAQLGFAPEVKLAPDTLLAEAPVGLGVEIETPQQQSAQAPATPPLRDATISLPAGLAISPAGAAGLRSCAASGPEGIGMASGLNARGEALSPAETGEGETLGPSGEAQLARGHCPEAATLGNAEASTPLLARPLQGRVYLATPGCGGPGQQACGEADALDGNLFRFYVELGGAGEAEGQGVIVKLEGKLEANPATGQLTVAIEEAPQLPLSRLKIELYGGPHALLDNPATCAPVATSASLVPWSAPGVTAEGLFVSGTPDATPASSYEASGCAEPPALDPGFLAGTVDARAGAFSALTLSVTRGDREQNLSRIQVQAPPGLLGMLASVPLCEAGLASAGACPQASRIGDTTVAAGAGSNPLEMPGAVYLTGPYEGAPFGLSIVTPVIAGPFDLGTVAIRARIDIDPHSGALTITSDPLPQIVLGVPLRLRRIVLELDRPGFIFNPTNCDAQQITATVTSTLGASAQVSTPFAVGGCRALAFKPSLNASARGRVGAASGASLDVKLAFPKDAPGSEANLKRIKLALPRQLAARLTTLQRACEDSVFEADPAACPKASIVGAARMRTPVLKAQLAGPVYFVSHGGAAFPSLVVVLQGEGIRFELTGSTEIDAKNVTSATFAAVPDVPVSSFELYLPQGAHSALGASASLCPPARTVTVRRSVARRVHGRLVERTVTVRKRVLPSLALGTELVAQNGAVIHRATKLEVSGCQARAVSARLARIPKFKIPTFL